MNIEPFLMERWQSNHEHHVEINLSDSGVHPVTLAELFLDPRDIATILGQRLIYTQTNGTPELRRAIAALYPDAGEENVEVVNGGAEANFVAVWTLVEPGDEVVVMLPNYMQIAGLVHKFGGVVRPWSLRPDHQDCRWIVDLDELRSLVTNRTKLITLCNPNNPTGACLDADELDAICQIADAQGAWVLSDEIYQGSEYDGEDSPTIWGRTDRAIITNSLSKAYGLPGLRLGWMLAPRSITADLWAHHDYTTIAPSALSDLIATKVMSTDLRRSLLSRGRSLLRENYALVASWLSAHSDSLRYVPPTAAAMIYLNYDHPVNSTVLAERLLEEKSVLIVPGDHFGMDRWLRIGFGGETAHIGEGLRRVQEILTSLVSS